MLLDIYIYIYIYIYIFCILSNFICIHFGDLYKIENNSTARTISEKKEWVKNYKTGIMDKNVKLLLDTF